MEAWINHCDKSVTLTSKLLEQGSTDGSSVYIYVNTSELRRLAHWLLLAAEKIDPTPDREFENFQSK